MKYHLKYIYLVSILLGSSCTKSEFLAQKPNTNIVVPTSVAEMTQLLDNQDVMTFSSPASNVLSADEYFYPSIDLFNSVRTKSEKNWFLWKSDIYEGETNIPDWNGPYEAIFYANVVLDQWKELSQTDQQSEQGKMVKGWAMFERGHNFFKLAQSFCKGYDQLTAGTDLGIPLRLKSDINDVQQRTTMKQTFDQIIADLSGSVWLLPSNIQVKNYNRPSRPSAYALLARLYLYMRNYQQAGKYADSALQINAVITDYNSLDQVSLNPFANASKELLYLSATNTTYGKTVVGYGTTIIDTSLIKLYDANDLRKSIFYNLSKENYFFKIGYIGNWGYYAFTGLATDELYLIKAEADARNSNLPSALALLNKLLTNRYKQGTYTPYSSTVQKDILFKIILERRKELVFRGLRWTDLKRLNLEGANITLTRNLDGKIYTLPPNDPKYVMPIPDDEIGLSHIQQNIR